MNTQGIKHNRILQLLSFYMRNECNYDLTFQRALSLGVSRITAKDYLSAVLARHDQLVDRSKNKALNK